MNWQQLLQWSCSCWLPTASCLTVATLYQLLNSYYSIAVASSGKDTIISRKQVPRAMSLERFPKVYETDLHVLRFVFSNFKINFINRLTLCHRSDLVQILDQKTFYIPNFHLFVGGERGFRFQVSANRQVKERHKIEVSSAQNRH